MSVKTFTLTGTLFALMLCSGPLTAYDRDGTCQRQRTEWLNALELFQQAVEDHRVLKDANIAPTIEQELREKGGRAPVARVVQEVLQQRAGKLAEAKKRVEALAGEEESSFERCKRCYSLDRSGRNALSKSVPEVVLRERLVAQMKDQTLDEGYAQYKDSRLPLPYTSTGGDGYASQAWYWERGAAGPSRGRGTGSGYPPYGYPNSPQPYPYYQGWR